MQYWSMSLQKKEKDYEPAEKNPAHFHGVSPFDIKTGKPLAEKKYPTYTDVFSKKLCQLGETHPELVAVTAAMPDGTGVAAFGKKFPDRFFDVGIAEAHAVTSAAGMAAAGLRPVVAVYSSFLQRGYDQILHDVCIQNLPVLFAVDRAGLVGSDGETHQGIFDYSYLTSIPNMSVAAPKISGNCGLCWILPWIISTFCYPLSKRYRLQRLKRIYAAYCLWKRGNDL